jgi:choice-of-anchor A domain-containing protein
MKYTYILFTLLALVLAATPARAAFIDLGVAGDYNAFILGDFTSNSSDTEGNLAVGGNATMSSYSIGGSVVVGKDFSLTDGSIGGSVAVGGTTSLTRVGTRSRAAGGHAPLPFDFDAAASYLKNLSLSLGSAGANGSVGDNSGVLTLNGDNASPFQVFNLDGSTLLNANTLYFNQIADDATVLINVSGDISGLTGMGMLYPEAFSDKVLFNFYEADTLLLDGVGIRGSILAPNARVTGAYGEYSGWGNIDGTLIAGSYNAHIEQHDVPFDPGTPVPEPGTFLITGLGLLGMAGFLRRGKRRKSA